MSAKVGALRVDLDMNSAKLLREIQKTQTRVQGLERRFSGFSRSATRSLAPLRAAIGALGVGLGARTFLQFADTANRLTSQLRLATAASGSFAQAQDDVRRIAAETRTGLEEVANLYGTFQRNARELGISQEQSARATETVTKSFRISGATAQEAAGGLRQFLQAIQSGQLRGEEFNSVMEQAPRLARLLADSLGVTIGQLRGLAQEGRLTGDVLMTALTDRQFTAAIDEEFRQLPVTFDEAMTGVWNAATIVFGAFDRGGRFSQAIANFFTQGSEGFAGMERDAENAGIAIRASMEGLGSVFGPLLQAGRDAFNELRGDARTLADEIAGIIGMWDDLAWYAREAVLTAGSQGNILQRERMSQYMDQYPALRFERAEDRFRAAQRGSLWGGFAAQNLNEIQARRRPRNAQTELPPRPPRPTGGGGGGRRRSGSSRPAQRVLAPWEVRQNALAEAHSEWLSEPSWIRSGEFDDLTANLRTAFGLTGDIERQFEDIATAAGEIRISPFTTEDLERVEQFRTGFMHDLSSGLADAIVAGKDLGDALIDTFKRASAALLESAIFQMLSGGSFGGQGGFGGVGSFITSLVGGVRIGGLKKMANGGTFAVGGSSAIVLRR